MKKRRACKAEDYFIKILCTLVRNKTNNRSHAVFISSGLDSVFDENKRSSRDCGRFLRGCGQVQHLPCDLHLTHAAEEVGDQDAAGVSQEQVGTVARSGHALARWTHFKLGERRVTIIR